MNLYFYISENTDMQMFLFPPDKDVLCNICIYRCVLIQMCSHSDIWLIYIWLIYLVLCDGNKKFIIIFAMNKFHYSYTLNKFVRCRYISCEGLAHRTMFCLNYIIVLLWPHFPAKEGAIFLSFIPILSLFIFVSKQNENEETYQTSAMDRGVQADERPHSGR